MCYPKFNYISAIRSQRISIYLKAPIVIEDFYLDGHERILDCYREALIPDGIQFPVHRPGLVDYPAAIFEFHVRIARTFNNK